MKGYIHQLESFGCADGPGSRFIIFFSGCPYRCLYCHNPDTWDMTKGKLWESDDLINEALSCKTYWGKKGGITVSGGEPLAQIDFLIELFEKAKAKGINTCIDTSGAPYTEEGEWFQKFQKLMTLTDTVMLDIKHINPEEHKKLTGQDGKNVRKMFVYLDKMQKDVWIRHVLVPGITDIPEYLEQTRDFIRTLSNIRRVEILPYHGLGITKYRALGIDYPLAKTESPTMESVARAKEILECDKYTGWKD